MTDDRLSGAVRFLRMRRGWRQAHLARVAGVSQSTVSRIERGHFESLAVVAVRRVLAALEIRLDLVPRWRGGDLERMLNAAHNSLHETTARLFQAQADWLVRPEVSFSTFGERGVIDVLAFHPGRGMLLVIELKTDLLDPAGLIAQVDRYRRLAPDLARSIGWRPLATSTWVVVSQTEANRHRLLAHQALLRARFPLDGRSTSGWLADPDRPIDALSFSPLTHVRTTKLGAIARKRVRAARSAPSRA